MGTHSASLGVRDSCTGNHPDSAGQGWGSAFGPHPSRGGEHGQVQGRSDLAVSYFPYQISAKAAFFHLPPWTPNKDQQLEAPHHCQAQHPRTCHLCSSLPFVLICCVFALIARLGQATVALCRTWRREVLQLGCCQRTDVTGWVTARC